MFCISLSNIGSVLSSDVSSRQTDYRTQLLGGRKKHHRLRNAPHRQLFTCILQPLDPDERLFIQPWKSVMWRWRDKKLTPRGFLWQVKKGKEQYCFIPFKQVALLDWKTAVREVEREKTQIFPSNTFIGGEKKLYS